MIYVTALAWAAASAAVYWRRPAVFLAVFLLATTTVLHGGWLGFGVLAALGGGVIAVGRLATPAAREAAWRLVRSPVSLGLALLVGGVWLSFLWNRSSLTPAEAVAMLRDAKGLTLALATYVAGFGLATRFGRVRMAIWALVAVTGVLGVLRAGQIFGVDVTGPLDALIDTTTLGDVGQYTQQNSYGTFVTLALALGLYVVLRPGRNGVPAIAGGVVLLVFQWLLLTSDSRTAIMAYALVLLGTLMLARGRHRWVVVLVGAGFAVLAVVYLQGPGQGPGQKPFYSAPPSLDPSVANAAVPPAARDAPGKPSLWSAALTTARLAVVQRIRVPGGPASDDSVLRMFIRFPAWTTAGFLDVDVDGTLVRGISPSREVDSGAFRWLEVPVSRSLLDGKQWIRVTLRVRGRPDSQINYVEVAGGAFKAEALRSEFFTGYGYMTEDLSNRRGWQHGTYLIFLNETWPERFQWLPPGSRFALDNSIIERVVWARVALANYAAHPVLGSGFGSLVFRAPAYIGASPVFAEFVNAHSNFFHILSELGIPGLAGWLLLVLSPIGLTVARRWRRGPSPIGAPFDLAFGGFALAWALASVTQYTVTDTRLFHVWLFYLGIWTAQVHRGGFGLLPWPWPSALRRKTAGAVMEAGAARR